MGAESEGGHTAEAIKTYYNNINDVMVRLLDHHSLGSANTEIGTLGNFDKFLWESLAGPQSPSEKEQSEHAIKIIGFGIAVAAAGLALGVALSPGVAAAYATIMGTGEVVADGIAVDIFGDASEIVENAPSVGEALFGDLSETAGSESFWKSENFENIKDFATTGTAFVSTGLIGWSTFLAGNPYTSANKHALQNLGNPDIDGVFRAAVDNFVIAAEASENGVYLGYAETLERNFAHLQAATAEHAVNGAALDYIFANVAPSGDDENKKYRATYRTSGNNDEDSHKEDYSLGHEESFWKSLGLNVVREETIVSENSWLQSLLPFGKTAYRHSTDFTVSDNGDGMDLRGIESFSYTLVYESEEQDYDPIDPGVRRATAVYAENFSVKLDEMG